jgi:hypothetical protein
MAPKYSTASSLGPEDFMPTDRVPIHAGDPPEVFEAEAKLLAAYRDAILRDVDDIIAKFADPLQQACAAAAYIQKIGSGIPDATIKAAVEQLAYSKFWQRGVDVRAVESHPANG